MTDFRKTSPRSRSPGRPAAWITPELIARTIAVWQDYQDGPITEADAVKMLARVGRLADTLFDPMRAREG